MKNAMTTIDLRHYDNAWYHPGRSFFVRSMWLFLGLPLLRSGWLPSSSFRVALLRLFGATIGNRVVIHSGVQIKYPWHLTLGDDCWIGERCWIDNLTAVTLGRSVCLSQGAYLCTGNHNWSDPAFGLRIAPIHLHDGAWAGAMCLLAPGTVLEEGAIAAAGSVVSGTIPRYQIFVGNPAVFSRQRIVTDVVPTATQHIPQEVLQ